MFDRDFELPAEQGLHLGHGSLGVSDECLEVIAVLHADAHTLGDSVSLEVGVLLNLLQSVDQQSLLS